MARYYEAMRPVVRLENAVGQVLADAQSDAGDELVDPEVLLTLTRALAAVFDPYDGTGR